MNSSPVLKYISYAALAIVALLLLNGIARRVMGFDEVVWRGEKFRLKKKYLDYEDYKSDINQLATNEVEHVKRVMLSISVPKTAPSEEALIHSLGKMRFPGFGSHSNGSVRDEHGNRYQLFEYEIPQNQELRTLLYRVEKDGSCVRVLDGASVDHQNDHMLARGQSETKVENGKLKHLLDGKVYREIELDTPK
jgi:hypothetical protein